jgi:hypothetical protein
MDIDLNQILVINSNISTIACAILTEASVLIAEANNSTGENADQLRNKAIQLNVLGQLILLGTAIVSKMLLEKNINLNSTKLEDLSLASKYALISVNLNVISNIFSYLAAVEVSKNNTQNNVQNNTI